jgi:hypothetical protein
MWLNSDALLSILRGEQQIGKKIDVRIQDLTDNVLGPEEADDAKAKIPEA